MFDKMWLPVGLCQVTTKLSASVCLRFTVKAWKTQWPRALSGCFRRQAALLDGDSSKIVLMGLVAGFSIEKTTRGMSQGGGQSMLRQVRAMQKRGWSC